MAVHRLNWRAEAVSFQGSVPDRRLRGAWHGLSPNSGDPRDAPCVAPGFPFKNAHTAGNGGASWSYEDG